MDNVIYAINNQTFHKNISITCGDAIIFTLKLSEEATSIVYSCAGNLHGDNYEFKKELGDGIIELGDHNYQIIVNSTDTKNLIQGIYNHNLRVETSGGVYTILDGLIFIESDIGDLKPQGGNPIFINYNSYIDGTITNAIVISAEIIPAFMFYECKDLINVYFSNNITFIGQWAFYNCTNLALTSLPNGVTSIGSLAFYNCTNLALTSLPNGVTSIGEYAFYQCINLTSLTFMGKPNSIAINAFIGCTNLTNIYVPWSEGEVANAPWGANNATIHYNS